MVRDCLGWQEKRIQSWSKMDPVSSYFQSARAVLGIRPRNPTRMVSAKALIFRLVKVEDGMFRTTLMARTHLRRNRMPNGFSWNSNFETRIFKHERQNYRQSTYWILLIGCIWLCIPTMVWWIPLNSPLSNSSRTPSTSIGFHNEMRKLFQLDQLARVLLTIANPKLNTSGFFPYCYCVLGTSCEWCCLVLLKHFFASWKHSNHHSCCSPSSSPPFCSSGWCRSVALRCSRSEVCPDCPDLILAWNLENV